MTYTTLASGVQTVTLRFNGWDIRDLQIDGPYTVTNLSIINLDVGGLPTVVAQNVWMTTTYRWWGFGFDRVYLPVILRNR